MSKKFKSFFKKIMTMKNIKAMPETLWRGFKYSLFPYAASIRIDFPESVSPYGKWIFKKISIKDCNKFYKKVIHNFNDEDKKHVHEYLNIVDKMKKCRTPGDICTKKLFKYIEELNAKKEEFYDDFRTYEAIRLNSKILIKEIKNIGEYLFKDEEKCMSMYKRMELLDRLMNTNELKGIRKCTPNEVKKINSIVKYYVNIYMEKHPGDEYKISEEVEIELSLVITFFSLVVKNEEIKIYYTSELDNITFTNVRNDLKEIMQSFILEKLETQ